MRPVLLSFAIAGLLAAAGCRDKSEPDKGPVPSEPRPAASASRAGSKGPRIVFLGDSLTAGLGLSADSSYPALLQRRLEERGYQYEVVNAGVSGDTSAGGLRRLDWALDGDVRILVVALGANDGLRGLPPAELKKNLAAILERATAKGITVILAGMEAPPNFGADYTVQFRNVYADLARTHNVRFVPFLLQGVAGVEDLNQGDGIHPNVRGARMVADLVWGSLEPVLSRPAAGPR
jgi:acyl-CoA thioesterase-1